MSPGSCFPSHLFSHMRKCSISRGRNRQDIYNDPRTVTNESCFRIQLKPLIRLSIEVRSVSASRFKTRLAFLILFRSSGSLVSNPWFHLYVTESLINPSAFRISNIKLFEAVNTFWRNLMKSNDRYLIFLSNFNIFYLHLNKVESRLKDYESIVTFPEINFK